VSKTLKHFRLRYKRGRESLHSPDPSYALKLAYVKAATAQAHADPVGCVLLYQDELTYYRRPSLAYDYAPSPSKRPAAPAGRTTNKARRIAGSLDVRTGQFFALQRRRFDRHALLDYYRQLEAAYPHAKRIFIVQDNWPVHFHPDILLTLANTKIMLLRPMDQSR
jgi:hypothetical protein